MTANLAQGQNNLPHDPHSVGIWQYCLVDPLLPPLTRWFFKVKVHPNLISVIAFLFACLSAIFYNKLPIYIGALTYHLSFILDCADGRVARMTHKESHFGKILDISCDRIGLSIVLIALLLRFQANSLHYIAAVLFMTLFMVNTVIVVLRPSRSLRKVAPVAKKNQLRTLFLGDVEAVMTLVVILPILNFFLEGLLFSPLVMIGRFVIEYMLYWRAS